MARSSYAGTDTRTLETEEPVWRREKVVSQIKSCIADMADVANIKAEIVLYGSVLKEGSSKHDVDVAVILRSKHDIEWVREWIAQYIPGSREEEIIPVYDVVKSELHGVGGASEMGLEEFLDDLGEYKIFR